MSNFKLSYRCNKSILPSIPVRSRFDQELRWQIPEYDRNHMVIKNFSETGC